MDAYLRGWPGWWDRRRVAPGPRGSAPRPGCCRPPCSCVPQPRCCPRRARGCRGSASPPADSWGHQSLCNTRERGAVSLLGTHPIALPPRDSSGGVPGCDIQEIPHAVPPAQSVSWQEGLEHLLSLPAGCEMPPWRATQMLGHLQHPQ